METSCRVLRVERAKVDHLVVRESLGLIAAPRFELLRARNSAGATLSPTHYPVCLLAGRVGESLGEQEGAGEAFGNAGSELSRSEASFILLTDREDYETDVSGAGGRGRLSGERPTQPAAVGEFDSLRAGAQTNRTEPILGEAIL